jgi:molybdopterin synthase catalytic subunit
MALLTRAPLDPAALLSAVGGPGRGGTALFLGTVRASPEDGPVAVIDYSAYEAMAEAEGQRILAGARERWPAALVAFQHRLGPVAVGEASVAVAAAAPHRGQAFDACRYVIEEIKVRLPVWKKERYRDGTASWRDNDGTRQPAERTPAP